MDKHRCMMCGHVYDPEKGETRGFNTILCNSATMELYECTPGDTKMYVEVGIDFDKLPADWKCPTCGYPKAYYRKVVPDTLHSMRTITF